MSWLGSNVLSFDIASTSPVFASSTTADTFLAPDSVLGLLHLLLDVELDVVVEGQLHGRPVDRVVPVAVAAGDHHAVGAAVIGDRPVGAGQRGVQRILESEQAVAVPVDAADDVGRQRSAGILAQVLALGADLGELRR